VDVEQQVGDGASGEPSWESLKTLDALA